MPASRSSQETPSRPHYVQLSKCLEVACVADVANVLRLKANSCNQVPRLLCPLRCARKHQRQALPCGQLAVWCSHVLHTHLLAVESKRAGLRFCALEGLCKMYDKVVPLSSA